MSRVGLFGWGIVAPLSPDIASFARNLNSGSSWLAPFNGFGPDNFLVGWPDFRFADYESWIVERFAPNRFRQLDEKMDLSSKYAIGAFIQSLNCNPGLESVLQELRHEARVYVGTGLGSLPTIEQCTLDMHRAQRNWDRYWAHPERNAPLASFLASPAAERRARTDVPADPESVPAQAREDAETAWTHYWATQSPALERFLAQVRDIEDTNVEGNVETAKLRVIREKRRRHARLLEEWGCPEPPWALVSPNVIWNIPNTPAAQISMLGKITGLSFAPVAACSTFGVALKLAMDSIRHDEAKAVVVGATDPPPHPLVVGAFYNARVMAADGAVSKPLTQLRGTHVSGGAVMWIIGDFEYMTAKGFKPVGMEPVAVGVSSDAEHIITPSREGPTGAIRSALAAAGVDANDVDSWDLHATATPGDFTEVETLRAILPEAVLVTARKGTFGHGMSAGGGWELTAQYLGYERGVLYPTLLRQDELNPAIAAKQRLFVFDEACATRGHFAGKLSMGVGGINACVISRQLARQ